MSDNADLVLEIFRAVEARDRERLFSLYHSEVEFFEPPSLPYGGTFRGLEEVRRAATDDPDGRTWLATWGPLQPGEKERSMDPRVVVESDEEVVVLYRQRAIGPGGERFDNPVLGLYRVRDSRLARAQMFHFDTAAIVSFLDRASPRTGG